MRTGTLIMTLALAGLILSCAPKKTPGPPPEWIESETSAAAGEMILGKGCAPAYISNHSFREMTARERARVDLAKNIDAEARKLLGGDKEAAAEVGEELLSKRETVDVYVFEDSTYCVLVGAPRASLQKMVSEGR